MAYRKTMLHHRIKAQAGNPAAAMGAGHPAVPAAMVTPLSVITVNPYDSNYVTLAMQSLAPLTTADGAMVPASGPGSWDQLRLAGGGRHG
jgi:hypothetical protein